MEEKKMDKDEFDTEVSPTDLGQLDEYKEEEVKSVFSDDDDLPVLMSAGYLKKDAFAKPVKVEILDFIMSKPYNKPTILVESGDMRGYVNLSNKNLFDLKTKFGAKKKDILGKKVTLTSKPYQDEKYKGFQLEIGF